MKITIDGVVVETSSVEEAAKLLKSLKKEKTVTKVVYKKSGKWSHWSEKDLNTVKENLTTPARYLMSMLKGKHSLIAIDAKKTALRKQLVSN